MASKSGKDLDTFFLVFNKEVMKASFKQITKDRSQVDNIVNSLEKKENKKAFLEMVEGLKNPLKNSGKSMQAALRTFYKNSPSAMVMDNKTLEYLVKSDVEILKTGEVHPHISNLQQEIKEYQSQVTKLQNELKTEKTNSATLRSELTVSLEKYNNLTRNLLNNGIEESQIKSWSEKVQQTNSNQQSQGMKV